jgi:RHS repeat-associated protein
VLTLTATCKKSFNAPDPQISFGPIAVGATATSTDTLTLRKKEPKPYSSDKLKDKLKWQIVSNGAPTANAGPNQTVARSQPGQLTVVQLNGSGTDPNNDPLTYRWTFVSVPAGSLATLDNTVLPNPSFTLDVGLRGTWRLQLIVNDGKVDSLPSFVEISTVNSTPNAYAGANQTLLAPYPQSVNLDGTGSTDADGDVLTYTWTFVTWPGQPTTSAPVIQTTSPASASRPTFVAAQAGDYVVQLVVNDGQANSLPASVTVTSGNTPPVADLKALTSAGSVGSFYVKDTIRFDASGSTDIDGNALTYNLSLPTVPTNSNAGTAANPLTSISPSSASVIIDQPGTYIGQVQVSDGQGGSNTATASITTQNSPPVANAGPDQSVVSNSTVSLDGSLSYDVDHDPLAFHWSFVSYPGDSLPGATPPVLTYTPGFDKPQFVLAQSGTYTLQLIVNDTYVDSAADTVVISTINSRPVAAITHTPTAPKTGDTVTVDGTGSTDADGDPLTYSWSILNQPSGSNLTLTDILDPAKKTFVPQLVGDYITQLIVNDGQLDSPPVTDTITVTAPVVVTNQPPQITSTPVSTATVGTAYSYPVIATDPNNDTLSYQLAVNPAASGLTINITSGLVQWANPVVGAYDLTITVDDGHGGSDIQKYTLTVSAAPAQAIVPTLVGLGKNAAIDAIKTAQLSVGTITEANDPTVYAGKVISQSLPANSQAAPGTAVDVVVSLGPVNGGLPPDPVDVASPVENGVTTILSKSTAFLYTGTNPIQTGVAPGTIEAKRAAVVKGKVMNASGSPQSGVTITVLHHPEYGQTLSRTDGQFDLAVNGGGLITLDYRLSGFLPVQRQVQAQWQDYVLADDVVMIARDPAVTNVDFSGAATTPQVARGSVMTDADGTRQATVLFPAGTTAQIYDAQGNLQTANNLHLHFTEFTVGDKGLKAMPAPLPPTSAYTYAVEMGADEVTTKIAGKDVLFNQPVYFYLDNFLGFPVGIQVPVGYYDQDKAAWVPAPDGRIIKIISITNSLADIDTDGNGTADNNPALGITDAERAQLASLYAAGKTLERIPVSHFSVYDPNYGTGCPAGQTCSPPNPGPAKGGAGGNNTINGGSGGGSSKYSGPSIECGSIIECENQILGESVPITGTPFSLNYRSDRVPGRKIGNTLQIPLTGGIVPTNLQRVDLQITVAGRTYDQSFPPNPNQSYTFTWDGRDAYGQAVQGLQQAMIRIGYNYPGVYNLPPAVTASFGQNSGKPVLGNVPSRDGVTQWQTQITSIDVAGGISDDGGWSLSVHHSYDLLGKTLYLGSGERQRADPSLGWVINKVAGNGIQGFSGDGGPATAAKFYRTADVAVSSDGSLYIADNGNYRIRRVGADGIITTVAGNGSAGFSGDGGPATAASLYFSTDVAVSSDGSLYIVDYTFRRIRRVGPDGIITTVAGNGTSGFSGDGGPATAASLYPMAIAVSSDGSLYIADSGNYRIRRVGPDGIITTVAGNGTYGFSGDGGPATAASLYGPTDVAVSSDGSLYFSDNSGVGSRIRRVGPDGIITTVAGNGTFGFSGDGGPATAARLYNPGGVALSADGSFYFMDTYNFRIRRVGPDGIITTVAGNGTGGFSGDGGLAIAAGVSPRGISLGADGSLYITDTNVIRRISAPFPGFSAGDLFVPSADGTELYQFNASGRHLKTLNALTGGVKYQFGYNTDGYPISVTDGDGNVTTVERDAAGNATAIVAPFGQRTTLTLDANDFLASITNPAGEAHHMTYTNDGLLLTFSDPNNHTSTMTYDALGRLLTDTNAAGGSKTLARTELNSSDYIASIATSLGRTTTHKVEYPLVGGMKRTDTAPDGTVTTRVIGTDGSITMTLADGTLISSLDGPDPRFSMMAPIQKSLSTSTGGLTSTQSTARTVNLTDPNNPLSLTSLSDTFTLNGRTSTSVFNAATKTATGTSAAGRVATSTIDAQGRLLTSQITGLNAISNTYDAFGRLATMSQGTNPDDRTATFAYNPKGELASVTDALNRVVAYQYDTTGRLTLQTLPDGRQIHYSYDANGNLTSLQPPGKPAHVFQYTAVDQASVYAPPAVAGVPNGNTTYVYDADKDVTDIVRPDGQALHFNYHATSGNLTNLVLQPANQTLASYSYDPVTGKLTSITDQFGGGLNYSYNGAFLTQTAWTGAVSGTLDATYDTDFRVTSLTVNKADPAAVAIAYSYDADSLLTKAGNLTLTRTAQNGLLSGTTLSSVTDSRTYDGFGEVTGYTSSFNTSALLNEQYTYDKGGRITQKIETIQGVANTFNYGYDPAGRLSEVKLNNAVQSSYTYDDNGNRLSGPGLTTAPTYDDQDRLLTYGNTTYSYTDNGELTSKTVGANVTTYHYDVLGNLLQVGLPGSTSIDYLVDGKNRRIGKKVNGALVQGFLYQDQLKPIAELDGNNVIVSLFVYATHANVPDYMIKGGVTYRIITDHLGSPRMIVNTADGTIAQQMNFDEFGRVTFDSNPGFQPFGFAGGLYDRDTGLVRFGARDYDAYTGRWTIKDPIGFDGGINIYGYVEDSPTNYYDPEGRDGLPIVEKLMYGILTVATLPVTAPILGTAAAAPFIVGGTLSVAGDIITNKEGKNEITTRRCVANFVGGGVATTLGLAIGPTAGPLLKVTGTVGAATGVVGQVIANKIDPDHAKGLFPAAIKGGAVGMIPPALGY